MVGSLGVGGVRRGMMLRGAVVVVLVVVRREVEELHHELPIERASTRPPHTHQTMPHPLLLLLLPLLSLIWSPP